MGKRRKGTKGGAHQGRCVCNGQAIVAVITIAVVYGVLIPRQHRYSHKYSCVFLPEITC